jgi:rubrerythrin
MKPDTLKGKIDLVLAKVCLNCPVCRQSRKKQEGAAYWFTSKVEDRVCPFCNAYKRVYGRKAHEPLCKASVNDPPPPCSTSR